jgi:hypothetical protein
MSAAVLLAPDDIRAGPVGRQPKTINAHNTTPETVAFDLLLILCLHSSFLIDD